MTARWTTTAAYYLSPTPPPFFYNPPPPHPPRVFGPWDIIWNTQGLVFFIRDAISRAFSWMGFHCCCFFAVVSIFLVPFYEALLLRSRKG